MQLLVESLAPQHPGGARRHGGALVRALGRRQHRHRGDDADVGVHRLPRLRRRSATARTTWALWLAVGVAVLTGGLIALLHALLSVTYRVDQIISGVVINLLALGPHRLPALRGARRHRRLHRRADRGDRPAAALRDPDRRASSSSPTSRSSSSMFVIIAVTAWVLYRTRVRAAGAVGRRAPARRRDGRHRPDPGPLPRGGDRRAHRRAGRRLVLARVAVRVPGQHDQRHRLHRAGRAHLRQVAAVDGVRRRHPLRLHPGAGRPPADPAGDDRRLLDPERVPARRSPTSSRSSSWPAPSAGPSPPAADGIPYERSR